MESDASPTEQMQRHITALLTGFSERIEYVVETSGGYERRAAVRRFDGLIEQLRTNSSTPLASRPQSGPSGPNGAGSRPPVNQVYADAVDTIHEQAIEAWALLHPDDPAPPDAALEPLLYSLQVAVCWRQRETRPVECVRVTRLAGSWVRQARILLGYEARLTMLADTVCGKCGGTLAVAADASTDVRCIGTSLTGPCGTVYGRTQWISLAASW